MTIAGSIALALPFLASGTQGLEANWLDESRVEVAVVIRHLNRVRAHVDAQAKLMRLAKKACKQRNAKAVSEGGLSLNKFDGSGKEHQLLLSEIYVCVTR